MTRRTPKSEPPAPELRQPTAAEQGAIRQAAESQLARPARVKLNTRHDPEAGLVISNGHSDGEGWVAHFRETFATSSDDFASVSLQRIVNAVGERTRPADQLQINAALALLGAISPRDEFEVAIAEQIVAAHTASLDFLWRARRNAGEYPEAATAYTNMATKVSRTMVAHIEALTKLRSGGKQQVIVKHVYVQGNAVVGDHAQTVIGDVGGGLPRRNLGQPHEPGLSAVPGAEMRGEDALRLALPPGSLEGEAPVPAPWGFEPGSSEGARQRTLPNGPLHRGTSPSAPAGPGDDEGDADQ